MPTLIKSPLLSCPPHLRFLSTTAATGNMLFRHLSFSSRDLKQHAKRVLKMDVNKTKQKQMDVNKTKSKVKPTNPAVVDLGKDVSNRSTEWYWGI